MSEKNQGHRITGNTQGAKKGQFFLSPLEAILINKKIPFGYKLESEENVLKSMEIVKQVKKAKVTSDKPKSKHYDNFDLLSNENSYDQPRISRDKKQFQRGDHSYNNKDNSKNRNDTSNSPLTKKFKKILIKIKSNPLSNHFYISSSPEMPSLSGIEKNMKNKKYETFNDFNQDLRRIWTYYFQKFAKNPDIYQKAFKMNQLCEEAVKEYQNMEEGNNNIREMNKKINSITKDLKDMKGNQMSANQHYKKGDVNIPISEKPLSTQEKTQLCQNIRNLPTDQLKGIIPIVKSTKELEVNESHMEFDIEKLPTKTLREVEKYVGNCLKNHPPKSKVSEDVQKHKTDSLQRKGITNQTQHTPAPQANLIKTNTQPGARSNTAPLGNTASNAPQQEIKKGNSEVPGVKTSSMPNKGTLSEIESFLSDSSSSSDSISSD